ncbi:hypothetical protein D1872_227580 [compost metagenome]
MGANVPLIPAFANTISIPPNNSAASDTAFSILTGSDTSTSKALDTPFDTLFIKFSVFCVLSLIKSKRATFAPSLASLIAAALPIPDPAPVTIAAFPKKRPWLIWFTIMIQSLLFLG